MKSSFHRTIASFLCVFYLFAGHAAVHGLSWCLAADDHAHLEQVAGVCDSPAAGTCSEEAVCPPVAFGAEADGHSRQSDCHHLPITSPHHSLGKQRLACADDSAKNAIIVPALPAIPNDSVGTTLAVRHEVEQLPPRQALSALRTIVLTC
ncbi:MAG TPA: hypothetical protein DCF93_02790 [Desulfuromonas sp.]|nr:hypothetical protein [Desulfuromonas sp.]